MERKLFRGSMWDRYSCSKSISRLNAPKSDRSTNCRFQPISFAKMLDEAQ